METSQAFISLPLTLLVMSLHILVAKTSSSPQDELVFFFAFFSCRWSMTVILVRYGDQAEPKYGLEPRF